MAKRFPASERFRAKLTANRLRADVSYFLCCTQQRKYIKRRLHTGHFDLKSLTPPPSPLLLQEFHGRPNGSTFRHYGTSYSNLCTFKRKNVP